ncbi:hypothetical protein [Legionella gresilensis]|uniref:hypothetical protein n=1 Tax=Legionella gresilensis TaxID=91823 RepID=UPI0010413454|nr:hypothetical protein [Legionella gresilensis]
MLNDGKEQEYFNKLIAIKDEINKQIPLAANRFEAFECPSVNESEHDIDIQYQLHEEVHQLMYSHYTAIHELRTIYKNFIEDYNIKDGDQLSNQNRQKLESFIAQQINVIFSKLESYWRLIAKFDVGSAAVRREKFTALLLKKIPALCEQGFSALKIDEQELIRLYILELQDLVNVTVTKLKANQRLSDKELTFIDITRREGTQYEEDLNQLVYDLYLFKHSPSTKINYSPPAIAQFKEDALYNIEQLAVKLRTQQHTYAQRFEYNKKLSSTRNNLSNNLLVSELDKHLRTVQLQEVKDKAEQKINEMLIKSNLLQRGLYYDLQKTDSGYCDEHTCMALVKLLKLGDEHRIEKVSINYEDEDGHTFLVIDRTEESELNDMCTWGEKAILLDPWNHLVCYVKDINNLDKKYNSYPSGANWSSIEFVRKDKLLVYQLESMYGSFTIADNLSPEVRESRIKEEYRLKEILPSILLVEYLNEITERYRPQNSIYKIKFYLTDVGDALIKYIPGFREPVIALHQDVFKLIVDKQLSLTGFEFEIVAILLKIKMYTSFVSPISISPEVQQRIDIKAMEQIGSADACVEYLRCAAEFKEKNPQKLPLVEKYERYFGGFNLKYVTEFTYAERIKMLQANIAAGVTKPYSKEVDKPSPAFCLSLATVSVFNNQTNTLDNTQNLTEQPKSIMSMANDSITQDDEMSRFSTASTVENQQLADKSPLPIQLKFSPSYQRLQILNKLLEQLPELKVELLPFEEYQAPSVRLREFSKIVESLEIDYSNPKEAELVDLIINRAHELKIPGFSYLYYAFASPWGTNAITDRLNLRCMTDNPQTVEQNYYYLVQHEDNLFELFYVDSGKNRHHIALEDINGLSQELKKITPNTKLTQYNDITKIKFLIKQSQGLRQLGFFKQIQKAITQFTLATSFEEAMVFAKELDEVRIQYIDHLADDSNRKRFFNHKGKEQNETNTSRYYGSDLGKFIKWTGFEWSNVQSVTDTAFDNFFIWAKSDKSGLIANILFRLGLSNHSTTIRAMTGEQIKYIAEKYSHDSYVFFGYLTGKDDIYFKAGNFSNLETWVHECESKEHQTEQIILNDSSLTFEEKFIKYYDENLVNLRYPHLEFNAEHEAQTQLLKAFYHVAIAEGQAEQAVVKSFFFGRDDKRDLQSLVGKYQSLKPTSKYFQFIFLQKFKENSHHLFDNYDLSQLIKKDIFDLDDSRFPLSLDSCRIIFRLPEQSSKDDLLILLLDECNTKNIKLRTGVIQAYLNETKQVVMFSKPVIRMLDELEKEGTHKADEYVSSALIPALNHASWPLLEDTSFPDLSTEELIKYYTLFDYYTTFPTRNIKVNFGNIIFNYINALPLINDQINLLELWLFKAESKLPLTDIALKNKLFELLINLYSKIYGKDDGTTTYFERIKPLILKLHNKLFNRDLKPFMSKLLTKLETQRTLSEYVGTYVDPADYKLFSSKRLKASRQGLITLIKLATLFGKNELNQRALLDYLSIELTQTSVKAMLQYVTEYIDVSELSRILGWNYLDYDEKRKDDPTATDEKLSDCLISTYHQFWECSLQERAAIIEQILIPTSQIVSHESQLLAYEKGLKYIAQKLFPKAYDKKSNDYLALSLLKSYLATADNFIRSYLLAAILVATNEHSDQEASIGKKLAVICEHMGPAYVKLAQAIHSHPQTTNEIRADLEHVKGRANPPHRWSLCRQMAEILPPGELANIKHIGKLLGSASYNLALEVTLENNETVVLLMLRENAEINARKGFEHIRATINHCLHEAVVNQRAIMTQMVDEAARLSENEMTKEAGDKQSSFAKQLYPSHMTIYVSGQPVELQIGTASILTSGQGYRFITIMHGEEFNVLPDSTPEQRYIKQAVAKAVITMELHNILRGGRFDSDRHGNQLRVEVRENHTKTSDKVLRLHIGLYDFGEMALEEPTSQELMQLAMILNYLPMHLGSFKKIDQQISNYINLEAKKGNSTHYLMRLRKSFLALHDFSQYLNQNDLVDIFKEVSCKEDIHPLLSSAIKRLAFISSKMLSVYQNISSAGNLLSSFGYFRGRNASRVDPPIEQNKINSISLTS